MLGCSLIVNIVFVLVFFEMNDLINCYRNRIEDLKKFSRKHKVKGFIKDLANKSELTPLFIYGFLAGDKCLEHDVIERLTNALND